MCATTCWIWSYGKCSLVPGAAKTQARNTKVDGQLQQLQYTSVIAAQDGTAA